jgi:hypothetical protein
MSPSADEALSRFLTDEWIAEVWLASCHDEWRDQVERLPL